MAHTINGTTHCYIFNPDDSDEFVRVEYDYTPEHTDRPFAGGDRRGDDYESETVPENIDVLSVAYWNEGGEKCEWVFMPLRFISAENMEFIHASIRYDVREKHESKKPQYHD